MKHIQVSLLVLALSTSPIAWADKAHQHPPATAATVGANGAANYGKPMPSGPATAISAVIDHTAEYVSGFHKISGRIAKVCQTEGCWMVLADGEKSARVIFADHGFVIPKDTQGEAEVYGTLSVKAIDEATAQHLAKDAGQDPAKVIGPVEEVQITATSVLIKPAR